MLLEGLLDRVANKGDIDLDAVVAATDLFTPADLSAVVQRSAAAAFHRAADGAKVGAGAGAESGGGGHGPVVTPLSTQDLLDAARLARPTISLTELDRFRRDAEAFTRI